MPLKPPLLSYFTIFLTFFEVDPNLLNTLGAGALVLTIMYMIIQLLKTIKMFNSPPTLALPPTIEHHSDPKLVEILSRLVSITDETRKNTEAIKAQLAVAMDRQVSKDEVRTVFREEQSR